MTNQIWEIVVDEAPLRPLLPRFSGEAGGEVEFWGVVRGQEDGREISGIHYEAHLEMARHQLDILAREAAGGFPILGLILHHRVGFVAAAEPSLFLRVSAAHRGPAFAAAQWLIEQLKERAPIWKHPVFSENAVADSSLRQSYPELSESHRVSSF
jgi:molybdopterin synthase catalytic subunit